MPNLKTPHTAADFARSLERHRSATVRDLLLLEGAVHLDSEDHDAAVAVCPLLHPGVLEPPFPTADLLLATSAGDFARLRLTEHDLRQLGERCTEVADLLTPCARGLAQDPLDDEEFCRHPRALHARGLTDPDTCTVPGCSCPRFLLPDPDDEE